MEYSKDFSCEVLSPDAATAVRASGRSRLTSHVGTTVVWSGLRSTYHGANAAKRPEESLIQEPELAVRQHLGVTFHRLISKKAIADRHPCRRGRVRR